MKHVVVIGAGIIGLSCADELSRRGFRVTIVERSPQSSEGCSFGNGGLIVPSHFVPLAAPGMIRYGLRLLRDPSSPFGVMRLTDLETIAWMARFARYANADHVRRCAPVLCEMNLASREIYRERIVESGVDVGYQQKGLLMLSQTEAGHEGEIHLAEDAQRMGLGVEILGREAVKSLEPELEMDVAGAVYFHDDAHLTPGPYLQSLKENLKVSWVEAEAQGIAMEGTRAKALKITVGEIAGDEFVLASGVWSSLLARTLGLKLMLRAGRGYGFTAHIPDQRMQIPSILTEARVAVTPMLDGIRFVGTMELGAPDLTQNLNRIQGMRSNISRAYPRFTPEVLGGPVWCGLRPCSPDGMPYLGRTRRASNLVVATGHAMMGMSLGPVTGKLVGEIVSDEKPSISLETMSPDRHA
ncbi:MAG: FAD-dependent oxidoreductase [Armatimonadetes bacterium]|nr:FAD-dependent oxidoreductase [Armatimonadota bacterium]